MSNVNCRKERNNVIVWARAVQDSIIAGNYNIPKEMIYAINNLQDAVNVLRKKQEIELPKDYVEFRDQQIAERKNRVMGLISVYGSISERKDS